MQWKSRGTSSGLLLVAVGAIVILGLIWFYGARNPAQLGEPTPIAWASPSTPSVVLPSPTAAAAQPAQGVATGSFIVPGSGDEFAAPACGDYNCDASERCDTCAKDCGCAGGEYCNRVNGICYELGN